MLQISEMKCSKFRKRVAIQTTRDISKIDNVGRSPDLAKAVLRSYARNVCTLSKTISVDVAANHPASDKTIDAYISALKKIHIVEDIPS